MENLDGQEGAHNLHDLRELHGSVTEYRQASTH
jgi:hypothetical protein